MTQANLQIQRQNKSAAFHFLINGHLLLLKNQRSIKRKILTDSEAVPAFLIFDKS